MLFFEVVSAWCLCRKVLSLAESIDADDDVDADADADTDAGIE